jgi:hypothetical protein
MFEQPTNQICQQQLIQNAANQMHFSLRRQQQVNNALFVYND